MSEILKHPNADGAPVETPPAIRPDGNVVMLRRVGPMDLPVGRCIAGATDAELTEIVIVGYTPDGDMWFSSSKANGPDVLWLLEKAKRSLLNQLED